jgi:hypothetical protein
MEIEKDLRTLVDRRQIERREVTPDSVKPFLGWIFAEDRRQDERRRLQRRQPSYN